MTVRELAQLSLSNTETYIEPVTFRWQNPLQPNVIANYTIERFSSFARVYRLAMIFEYKVGDTINELKFSLSRDLVA